MERKIPKLFFAFFLLFLYCDKTFAQAPAFTSSPVNTGVENVNYTYSLSATDPNNNPLTFSTSNLPSWLSLPQGQNSSTQIGTTITIEVADDYQAIHPNNTVSVYDKGERKLIEVKHYDNSWKGSYQGSPLTEGTCFIR